MAVFCSLTLQICLIIGLSFRCRRKRQDFVTGQVSLAWSIALRTHELYTRPRVLKERWREERTGFSFLNFFQAVFARVVVEETFLYNYFKIDALVKEERSVKGFLFLAMVAILFSRMEPFDQFW